MAMASKACAWVVLVVCLLVAVVFAGSAPAVAAAEAAFDENYVVQWGEDGYHLVIRGTEANITMDQSSGAGFRSKSMYGSGFFHMRMKLPSGYTAGVVTTFYLISQPEDVNRDEVDFEFLGDAGVPITLQTNVFVNGRGDREQRLHLWFDPAADFHDYKILWNPYQLVMFVDDTPVRVLRNLTATVPGYPFPAKQTMLVRASVWDGSDWATDGGRTKVDWSQGPFTAGYRGFDVSGCANGSAATPCQSPDLWWNAGEYRSITAEQRASYEDVKRNYMNYDYCADKVQEYEVLPTDPWLTRLDPMVQEFCSMAHSSMQMSSSLDEDPHACSYDHGMELDSLNSAQKLLDDALPLATHDNTSVNVDQVVLTLRLA